MVVTIIVLYFVSNDVRVIMVAGQVLLTIDVGLMMPVPPVDILMLGVLPLVEEVQVLFQVYDS